MKEWIHWDTQKTQSKRSANEKKTTSTKIQKFNNFKYKPREQIKATTFAETENTEKPTYIKILRTETLP